MEIGYHEDGYCYGGIQISGYSVRKYYEYYECCSALKMTNGDPININGWTCENMFVTVGYYASWGSICMTDQYGESMVFSSDQINKGYSSYYRFKIIDHLVSIVDLIHKIAHKYKSVGQYRILYGLNKESRSYEMLIKNEIKTMDTKYCYNQIMVIMNIIKEYDDLYKNQVSSVEYTEEEIAQLEEKHDEFMDMFFPLSIKFKYQRTRKK